MPHNCITLGPQIWATHCLKTYLHDKIALGKQATSQFGMLQLLVHT